MLGSDLLNQLSVRIEVMEAHAGDDVDAFENNI
jgi:hypothetical protein